MQQLRFYCTERLQLGTGDKASDAQRNRLGHSRINACGDGTGSSVDEARGSSLLEGEYVTNGPLMRKVRRTELWGSLRVCSVAYTPFRSKSFVIFCVNSFISIILRALKSK